MKPPGVCTFEEVEAACPHVYRYLNKTPLHEYAGLSELIGAQVFVKHENHHAVRVFKVRGGVNLAASLGESSRKKGICTASTGNHGQSIAFAGQVTGVPVRVALPEGANPSKAAAIRALGAEVAFHGRDFDEAREWIGKEAARTGARFIGPTDAELIAGVGTYTLEIMEAQPDIDVIIVPVGRDRGLRRYHLSPRRSIQTFRSSPSRRRKHRPFNGPGRPHESSRHPWKPQPRVSRLAYRLKTRSA